MVTREQDLLDIKTHYKALTIKTVMLLRHEWKMIHITIKYLEMDLNTHRNLISNKSSISNHWRQDSNYSIIVVGTVV